MSEVLLCGGTRLYVRRVFRCPVEGVRRRIVMAEAGGYWTPIFTCCGCGDSWGDGELMERPFVRGWRERAKKKARANWAAGVNRTVWRDFIRRELAEMGLSA